MSAQEERDPLDIIRDAMTDQEFVGYCKGKVIEGMETEMTQKMTTRYFCGK